MEQAEKSRSERQDPNYLAPREANHAPLSPLAFLRRAAAAHPNRVAIRYNGLVRTWAETDVRVRRLASALIGIGVKPGDVVAVMGANTPELYEAHFGIPLAGAILCALNIRLDADTIAYSLGHGGAKMVLTDSEFAPTMRTALAKLDRPVIVVDIVDPAAPGDLLGSMDYEALLAAGDPAFAAKTPADEWNAITLNYTSGTTGRPKGVLYHHRGAYLNAIGNILEWDMGERPVYLWTLPMFHCNGWCFPWTLAAKAGTNVCLRKVTAQNVYRALVEDGVDHLCGAPIVLRIILDAPPEERARFTGRCKIMTAGAPPPAAVLQDIQARGFDVTHTYGLTEVYGPAVVCAWRDEWRDLSAEEQAGKRSRQGLNYSVLDDLIVADPKSCIEVPRDGETLGEVLFRGNIVMKGYLDDEAATEAAFAGGWFHSGDLAVRHPDGYVQLKDRLKDIIISGGENISSIEVEDAIHHHPAVTAAAVVAMADEKWGEVPVAFVELAPSAPHPTADELIAFCRGRLAGYKCPRKVFFTALPRTSTGKIQKRLLRDDLRTAS